MTQYVGMARGHPIICVLVVLVGQDRGRLGWGRDEAAVDEVENSWEEEEVEGI